MKPISSTFWFIEPLDPTTNRICAENLAEENACSKQCEDGKSRNLWRSSHFEVQRLENVRAAIDLHFNVFVQHGMRGPLRVWLFGRPRVNKSALQVAA